MPKSVKTNVNILHQEKLIAQKKREIEAKMEQQAKRNHLASQQVAEASECVSSSRPFHYIDGWGEVASSLPF